MLTGKDIESEYHDNFIVCGQQMMLIDIELLNTSAWLQHAGIEVLGYICVYIYIYIHIYIYIKAYIT